jgi:hypothetical protein
MDEKTAPKLRPPRGSALRFVMPSNPPERARVEGQLARAKAVLAEPFKGISAAGTPEPGLFPLRKTGISVQPIVDAVRAFDASLTPEQRQTVSFAIDSNVWRAWNNTHRFLFRHGLLLRDLGEAQRVAALALIRASLSASGYDSARDVMKLNEHACEITNRTDEFGEWFYWISLFGQPSLTEPWGWQIDGHHLNVNCLVLGDQIALTPDFRGSEPVHATFGKYAGTHVFHDEETRGLALMTALTPEQQRQAVIGAKVPRDVSTAAQSDNVELAYAGIRYDALTEAQQALLLSIVESYVGRIRTGHAEIRMDEVRAHLPRTWFGWIGGWDDSTPFYYRIHSPVILIEFDHLPGILWDNDYPTRRHIHTIVRTPNGNDYGQDLLRQHYHEHDHSHPLTPHRRGVE